MLSIVSRRPPPSVSTNQANDFFWMSMRFGTSIDLSRRAKVRRVREASTEAKAATPRGEGRGAAGEVHAADGDADDGQHSTQKSARDEGAPGSGTQLPGVSITPAAKDAANAKKPASGAEASNTGLRWS